MLRPLAILAGLVLLALVVVVLTHEHVLAPVSMPSEATALRPEDHHAGPLSSVEISARNAAGTPAAADANYVGIIGECTREEDGTAIEGGIANFAYRYLRKGPDSELRHVPVDIGEHGQFEQFFSEPVQLVSCEIIPVDLEAAYHVIWPATQVADFLATTRALDLPVESKGKRLALSVVSGLEIHGTVIDAETRGSLAHALVWARVDSNRCIGAVSRSDGSFRLRGFAAELAAPDRDFVSRHARFDVVSEVKDLVLQARADGHSQGQVEVSLPLSALHPRFIELPLTPGARISGRVIDSLGECVPDACVTLVTWMGTRRATDSSDARSPRAFTRNDGTFVIASVPVADGGELRAFRAGQQGAPTSMLLAPIREDRESLELVLPETQLYRLQVRGLDGKLARPHEYSLHVRNRSGDHDLSATGFADVVRIYLPVGESSELLVSCDSGGSFRPVVLHAKTTIEPSARKDEPETITLDLQE